MEVRRKTSDDRDTVFGNSSAISSALPVLALIASNTYATSARTSDGSLVKTYMPTIRTVMSKLAGLTAARWFDPTNGIYITINGSPFPNAGNRRFTPPHNNSAGDGDWVLVLEADARSE
jgi:hypothetical protein